MVMHKNDRNRQGKYFNLYANYVTTNLRNTKAIY